MKPSFERHSAEFGIKKENLKNRELPVVTAYIIRHGETTEDKLNPNRGLTLEGENQADEAAERLISELNPATDVIQILDSGNYRANATVMRIAQKLKSAGFKFFNLIHSDKDGHYQDKNISTHNDPESKSYNKIAAANIPDSFKIRLADSTLHSELGIPDDIPDKRMLAWFMLREEGMETPEQVTERVKSGMADTQKQLPKLNSILTPDQRIVVVAAGNATMVDSLVTSSSGVHPKDRGGEINNCEGFKVDFNLKQEPQINLWGENIEKYIEK